MIETAPISAQPPALPEPSLRAAPLAFFLSRCRVHFWLKQGGTAAIMTGFFVLYFTILNHPIYPVTLMPLTAVDRWIGFQPAALIFYVSLWIYVPLLPSLMTETRELWRYAGTVGILSFVGLGIFVLCPTTIPRPDIDWSQYPSLAFLKTIDASGNACPSLHVAFAVFTALGLDRRLRDLGASSLLRLGNLLWGASIVYSTLATKQHVALDALFGTLLGTLVAVICLFPRPLLASFILVKICAVSMWLAGFPLLQSIAVFFCIDGLVFYHLLAPNAQGLCRVFTSFHTDAPEVWLTIDDGPDKDDTPRLLDLLDRHQAKATFFVIGKHAVYNPDLIAEIRRRGHEIGHHTHTHPLAGFWCAFPARLRNELDKPLAVLGGSGPRPRRFRAPAGIKNFELSSALAERDLACVGWTVRSRDTLAKDPDVVVARVMKKVRPGAILLMHEGARINPQVRVKAIAGLLEALTARGFRCVVPTPEQLR